MSRSASPSLLAQARFSDCGNEVVLFTGSNWLGEIPPQRNGAPYSQEDHHRLGPAEALLVQDKLAPERNGDESAEDRYDQEPRSGIDEVGSAR